MNFCTSDYSVQRINSCARRKVLPVNQELLSHMACEGGVLQLWNENLLFSSQVHVQQVRWCYILARCQFLHLVSEPEWQCGFLEPPFFHWGPASVSHCQEPVFPFKHLIKVWVKKQRMLWTACTALLLDFGDNSKVGPNACPVVLLSLVLNFC